MTNELASRIWANRRQQNTALAKAAKRDDIKTIELEAAEWELLRRGDALGNKVREATEKSQ